MRSFTRVTLRQHLLSAISLGILASIAVSCQQGGESGEGEVATAGRLARLEYASETDTLPRIRFTDGLVSLNDRCMVRRVKLNAKVPPVYVSGQPVGFC